MAPLLVSFANMQRDHTKSLATLQLHSRSAACNHKACKDFLMKLGSFLFGKVHSLYRKAAMGCYDKLMSHNKVVKPRPDASFSCSGSINHLLLVTINHAGIDGLSTFHVFRSFFSKLGELAYGALLSLEAGRKSRSLLA